MLRSLKRSAPNPTLQRASAWQPRPLSTIHRPGRFLFSIPSHYGRSSTHRSQYGVHVHPASKIIAVNLLRTSASFHSTSRNQGLPLIPLFASILKASTAFEIARTLSRIALTFLPVVLVGRAKSQYIVKHAHIHGVPISDERKEQYIKKVQHSTVLLKLMIFVPFALFWATIIASLERTPLTGRWRTILLSPEEEDEIAAHLAGAGWYNAVNEILAQDGQPHIIPTTDWRYEWVQDTMNKLAASIPVLADEPEMCRNWIGGGPDEKPLPPPAVYPLRPRPRAAEYLRWFCERLCDRHAPLPPHSIPGPNYSLLVVDCPEASNAFSYGFGPDGGGGVVVYSGFLDDIFAKFPLEYATPADERSWLSRFFSTSPPPQPQPVITLDHTTELAILLAHELSHLILSHHLETLSSATIVVPGTLSILSDVIRVLIFPITMIFGPFVNDAVAQLGKVGSGELLKIGEHCTTTHQEIEADVVSARLLAHSGFDARDAVKFWESRAGNDAECHRAVNPPEEAGKQTSLARKIMGSGHPVSETRVKSLRNELARWEEERRAAAHLQQSNT